ncbi:MAG TPA: hypothetical protein VFS00_17810 [Polyangiaceae bacterium]|nr:hypothetical protein [Polyangiaceae bacterium]
MSSTYLLSGPSSSDARPTLDVRAHVVGGRNRVDVFYVDDVAALTERPRVVDECF